MDWQEKRIAELTETASRWEMQWRQEVELRNKDIKRIAELEAALGAVLGYIPDGWIMPWGFDQIASRARAALKEVER